MLFQNLILLQTGLYFRKKGMRLKMELQKLEEEILSKNDCNQTKRNMLIENVLNLNINSGKLDGNVNSYGM